jgi:hypothetical protein
MLAVGCTSPRSQDQFRIAQGYAMQAQQANHQQATLSMASRNGARLNRSTRPMVPFQPLQPFGQ